MRYILISLFTAGSVWVIWSWLGVLSIRLRFVDVYSALCLKCLTFWSTLAVMVGYYNGLLTVESLAIFGVPALASWFAHKFLTDED